MQDSAFTPRGPTYAVDSSAAVQCKTTDNVNATSYRIRNTTAGASYIGWAPQLTAGNVGTPAVITTAPIVGTPQGGINGGGVIGMLQSSVEVFVLPANAFFKATAAGTFEVTPGEGV